MIRCYPISPRTQCTIASISKSITSNNPRLPAAKEEEEEGGGRNGRNGIFPPPQSPRCLHHPTKMRVPHLLSWLALLPPKMLQTQALLRQEFHPQTGSREPGSQGTKAAAGDAPQLCFPACSHLGRQLSSNGN